MKELTNIALPVLVWFVLLPARPLIWVATKIEPWTVSRLMDYWVAHTKWCKARRRCKK